MSVQIGLSGPGRFRQAKQMAYPPISHIATINNLGMVSLWLKVTVRHAGNYQRDPPMSGKTFASLSAILTLYLESRRMADTREPFQNSHWRCIPTTFSNVPYLSGKQLCMYMDAPTLPLFRNPANLSSRSSSPVAQVSFSETVSSGRGIFGPNSSSKDVRTFIPSSKL